MSDPETQAIRRLAILGGPAFPTPPVPGQPSYLGLTARDWFAGMALTGLVFKESRPHVNTEELASLSYRLADAMLKERRDYGNGDN